MSETSPTQSRPAAPGSADCPISLGLDDSDDEPEAVASALAPRQQSCVPSVVKRESSDGRDDSDDSDDSDDPRRARSLRKSHSIKAESDSDDTDQAYNPAAPSPPPWRLRGGSGSSRKRQRASAERSRVTSDGSHAAPNDGQPAVEEQSGGGGAYDPSPGLNVGDSWPEQADASAAVRGAAHDADPSYRAVIVNSATRPGGRLFADFGCEHHNSGCPVRVKLKVIDEKWCARIHPAELTLQDSQGRDRRARATRPAEPAQAQVAGRRARRRA